MTGVARGPKSLAPIRSSVRQLRTWCATCPAPEGLHQRGPGFNRGKGKFPGKPLRALSGAHHAATRHEVKARTALQRPTTQRLGPHDVLRAQNSLRDIHAPQSVFPISRISSTFPISPLQSSFSAIFPHSASSSSISNVHGFAR